MLDGGGDVECLGDPLSHSALLPHKIRSFFTVTIYQYPSLTPAVLTIRSVAFSLRHVASVMFQIDTFRVLQLLTDPANLTDPTNLALLVFALFCAVVVIIFMWGEYVNPWRSQKRRRRTTSAPSSSDLAKQG